MDAPLLWRSRSIGPQPTVWDRVHKTKLCLLFFFYLFSEFHPLFRLPTQRTDGFFLLASIFAGSEVNKNGEQPHSCRSLLSISHLWKTKTVYALARFFILINKTLWSPTGWKHSFEYFLRQYLFCFMSTAAKHATVVVPRRCPLASTMSSFVRLNVILIALKCKTFWKQIHSLLWCQHVYNNSQHRV